VKFVQMREGEVVRLWTDNQVTMAVIAKMVSRSPALMAEMRRLRKTLQVLGVTPAPQYIPSALNLFADRLSRHRKEWDWYASVRVVPDSRWCGAVEQNWAVSWRHGEFVRPPLEMLPLARTKAEIDGFSGVMLVPHWPGRIWFNDLTAACHSRRLMRATTPGAARGKRRGAVLISFSPQADRRLNDMVGSERPSSPISLQTQCPGGLVHWRRGARLC
jgi:hypothetical protein